MTNQDELRILQRIATGIERLSPQPEPLPDIKSADAFVWDAERKTLIPVHDIAYIDVNLLKGIDHVRDILLANSMQFAKGLPANNALLWGARGMGKSSLVKALHAHINQQMPHTLALIEIHREDIHSLPQLITMLRGWITRRFILFCDDLSFDNNDSTYKSLKTVLEGGLEGRPEHILFYATSNRRHLMAREMIENERSTAIHPGESTEEKISLSDRFGLWLGFHSCPQDVYLRMVHAYVEHYKLTIDEKELNRQALEWAATRGARSGRVAWQFMQDLAGRMGKKLS
jgi:uncharacterized protein